MNFDDLVKKKGISLSCKKLRDDDLGVLIEVVQKSDVLEELKLSSNRLILADGKMAEAIAHSRTLRVLLLDHNEIADEGAKRLADAIKENKTLQKIYLWNNEIGDDGAESFADALAVNKSLRRMDLRGNKIGDEGAKRLAASFEANRSLETVFLHGNNITDQGAQRLADCLKTNYTIKKLGLGINPISGPVKKNIEAILNDEFRTHVQKIIACKDQELENKEKEIASLKAGHSASLKTIDSLKESFKDRLEQLKMFIDTVDLTGGDPEPPSKRPRMENAAKSNLAVLNEQNQKMVRIKEEKNAAETALEGVREEKAAVEADRDEVRDDLEDANELVQQEALATDVWMRRFDELAAMVKGHVDGAVISEIRNRSLASGS